MATTDQPTTFTELYTALLNRVRADTSDTATITQAKRYINIANHDLHIGFGESFPWAERSDVLRTKVQYTTGPISISKGSTAPAGAPPFVDPLGLRDVLGDDGVPFARRVDQLSDHLRGLPYLDSPLGEGAGYDPDPLVRWDAVDCVTYVEQVLALANAPTSSSSLPVLLDLRYRDGRASFGTRNHLMMAQWVPVNIEKGYLRDVTREVGGDRVEIARKTITEEMWSHRSGVDLPLSKSEVPIGEVELPYIPLALFPEVMTSVPDGSLLIVVREDLAPRPYRVPHPALGVSPPGTWVVAVVGGLLAAGCAVVTHGGLVDVGGGFVVAAAGVREGPYRSRLESQR